MLVDAAAPRGPVARRPDHRGDRLVRDLMSRDPVTVLHQASLEDAADLLYGYGVSALPVVDDDGRLTGVISQTDLVTAAGPRRRRAGLASPDGGERDDQPGARHRSR